MKPENNSDRLDVSRRKILAASTAALPLLAGCTGSTGDDGDSDDSGGNDDDGEGGSGGKIEAIIGEVVDGGSMAITVEAVEATEQLSQFDEADEGNEFVVLTMGVKNQTDDEFIDFSSFLQTRIKDDEDYTYDTAVASTGRPMEGGQLAPGEVTYGDIAYEVPQDATGRVLEFDFGAFDLFDFDRVIIDMEDTVEEPERLQQDLQVNIHDVDDAVKQNGMEVVLNGVQFESDLGQFAEVDEGNEFAIPDISVTNDTGEATSVSIALQMVMKDGEGWIHQADISGFSALDRQFEQGSEIGNGETRRGQLAYQVPEDADELYWAFEFDLLADGTKTFWQIR